MTAEGTARSGAGEAPRAELAAEKVSAPAAGERHAEEREGVGGPFVIVNGDSDGGSDKSGSRSDEEDLPPANASPDSGAGGDHATTVGAESGASDAAVGLPSSNGHGAAPAVESEDGVVGETKADNSEDGLGEQGTAGGELGGQDAPAEVGIDHADAGADSTAPAVDSVEVGIDHPDAGADSAAPDVDAVEVGIDHPDAGADSAAPDVDAVEVGIDHPEAGADSAAPDVDAVVDGKESEEETSAAAADVAAPEEQQDGASPVLESSTPDDTPTDAESEPIALESEASGEQGEEIAAETMELGADGSGVSEVNGQRDADMSVEEPVNYVDKGEHHESTIKELQEQDGSNGHAHVEPIADSPELDTDGGKGQQTALKTEHEVLDGSGYGASKGPVEEEAAANGLGCAEDTADTSAELDPEPEPEPEPEPAVGEGVGEVESGVVETEDIIGKDSEVDLCDGHTAVAVSSEEEAKPPAKEEINEEAIPAEAGACVITANISEQIVQDDELVKNDVSSDIIHSEQSEPDQVVEPEGDQDVQVEVAAGDGNTPVSDVKAVTVEMNTSDSVQTQDLGSAFEDRSIPLHENLSSEVEEEVNGQACPEDAHLALNDYSSVQIGKQGKLELPGAGVADKSDSVVVEAEQRKEEIEVVDVVPLDVPAASAVHNEPRSIEFINNDDRINHLNPDTELESSDHVQAMECSSREISGTTVDQLLSSVSGEHGTVVTDDSELRYRTGDASLEISSETAVDQGEPVALDGKLSSATGSESAVVSEASDIFQTGESPDLAADHQSKNDQPEIYDASTACEELVSPAVEGPHQSDVTLEPEVKAPCMAQETGMSDVTCKDVENINVCNISSQEVETKCLEGLEPSSVDGVVPVEHKDDDKNAQKGKEKIAEDSSESPVDLDKSHKGDIKYIGPPNLFRIVKVPRLAGDDVWARVQEAQGHLDRLTQERDALNVRRIKQRAVADGYREKLVAARKEESEARAAFVEKRNGLDSARAVIVKLSQANSIEEIDELIARKEKIMEHETIPLKQEKAFIKDINDLKAQRKQVCSNLGSKAEISEAFHQKDHIHEQHKTLKKEADLLSKNLKSLEENRKTIQISFENEKAVLGKLDDEYHAADAKRQQAYQNWRELRAEPNKKNMYFRMYMRDRDNVSNYQKSRDMGKLQSYCKDQVENFMAMWIKDDDFRRMYVEANKISTLKRLGTHDGRSLGLDEDPPVIPRNNFNRRPNNPSQLTASSPNVPITTSIAAPEKSAAVVVPVEEDSFPVLPSTQIHKQAKSKTAGSSSQKEVTTAPASEVENSKHIEKEKARPLKEELEKADGLEQTDELELGREKEKRAAAEKERIKLEQKAKAKEAEERKKKQLQKAQERAEYRLQKEAEQKEKKKLEKEKKLAALQAGTANGNGEGNQAAIATTVTDSNSVKIVRDSEVPKTATTRKVNRGKQLTKLEAMPEPLRNKGKKKTQQYVFIGVAVALAVVALILAGRSLNLPGFQFSSFLN